MTTTAALWIVGCGALGALAACSLLLISYLARQKPADRVSDKWLDDLLRERRTE